MQEANAALYTCERQDTLARLKASAKMWVDGHSSLSGNIEINYPSRDSDGANSVTQKQRVEQWILEKRNWDLDGSSNCWSKSNLPLCNYFAV